MQELEIGEYYMYHPPQINNTNYGGNLFTKVLFSNHAQSENRLNFSSQYVYRYEGNDIMVHFDSKMTKRFSVVWNAFNLFTKVNDLSLKEIKKYKAKLPKPFRRHLGIYPWRISEDGRIVNYIISIDTLVRNSMFAVSPNIDVIREEVARNLHTNGIMAYYLWRFVNKDKEWIRRA